MYKIMQSNCLLSNGKIAPEFRLLRDGVPILRQSVPFGTTVGSREPSGKKQQDLLESDISSVESLFEKRGNQVKLDKVLEKYEPSLAAPISLMYYELYSDPLKAGSIDGVISNFIGGRGHHNFGPDFTEIMLIVPFDNPDVALKKLSDLYHTTRAQILKQFGPSYALNGLEGGFVVPASNEECLDLLSLVVDEVDKSVCIGIDVAAECLVTKKDDEFMYRINDTDMTGAELTRYYLGLLKKYPKITYLEDPFHSDDRLSWKNFFEIAKKSHPNLLVVADDLVVSNSEILDEHHGLFNSVICKINQAGTVTRLQKFIRHAKKMGCKIVMSQRSVETDGDFVIDLGLNHHCDYFKLGAPSRERIIKYNSLARKLR
jgi:enolase